MDIKNITVVGSGPLSLSLAAQYADYGDKVFYVDLTENESLLSKKVKISGIWNTEVEFEGVSFSLNDIPECREIAIAITPSHFEQVFPIVISKLKKGMKIHFFPASFGAMIFTAMLKKEGINPADFVITESVSYPYVCAMKDSCELLAQSKKQELRVSVFPQEKSKETIDELNKVFGIFESAKNFLETSLDNMNMSLHPLPVLLNLGAMESQNPFRHYIDGVTPSVGALMDKLDAERMKIGEALGLKLSSALEQLKKYYGDNDSSNLYQYVASEKGPYTRVGKFNLSSRYVQEDIPYLLVPAIAIADDLNIDVPAMKLCVELANSVLNTDFYKTGFNKTAIGL